MPTKKTATTNGKVEAPQASNPKPEPEQPPELSRIQLLVADLVGDILAHGGYRKPLEEHRMGPLPAFRPGG